MITAETVQVRKRQFQARWSSPPNTLFVSTNTYLDLTKAGRTMFCQLEVREDERLRDSDLRIGLVDL